MFSAAWPTNITAAAMIQLTPPTTIIKWRRRTTAGNKQETGRCLMCLVLRCHLYLPLHLSRERSLTRKVYYAMGKVEYMSTTETKRVRPPVRLVHLPGEGVDHTERERRQLIRIGGRKWRPDKRYVLIGILVFLFLAGSVSSALGYLMYNVRYNADLSSTNRSTAPAKGRGSFGNMVTETS